ncbi:MAG: ATP synthase F1 subunit epsilon [Allobaculum sp.]|nr:ATP synthase F1 subunit epsilon [Allobaculum sp.]
MINLKIVTPNGRYLEQLVKSIHARSVMGEFTLLPNHMPIVMSLVPCRLRVINEKGETEDFAISGGVLHYDEAHAAILTDAIEGKAEIDTPRAQKAYIRARKRLEKHDDLTELRRNELALQRAINRLSVTNTSLPQ